MQSEINHEGPMGNEIGSKVCKNVELKRSKINEKSGQLDQKSQRQLMQNA